MIEYKSKSAKRESEGGSVITKDEMLNLYRRVYSMPKFVLTLKVLGALSVFYVAGVFLYGISVLIYYREYAYALCLTSVAAIPFIAVSLMRTLINSPRPYEVFDVPELEYLKMCKKSGKSFPSRHVFSAFLIGALWLPYSVPFGITAIILGAFMAVERVLLGIHFIKDVLVGAVIGVLSGTIGVLIL